MATVSDLPIPPGELLAETIETAGLTQADLARRMGRPAQAINEIIRGAKEITAETAIQLERVLGIPNDRTNATVEGQTTAHYITERLKGLGLSTSKLAHGVPVGGELDYLDEGTLTAALKARRAF